MVPLGRNELTDPNIITHFSNSIQQGSALPEDFTRLLSSDPGPAPHHQQTMLWPSGMDNQGHPGHQDQPRQCLDLQYGSDGPVLFQQVYSLLEGIRIVHSPLDISKSHNVPMSLVMVTFDNDTDYQREWHTSFLIFLHIDTGQVVEILLKIRQEPTYST